jgi:hypothetical protein
VTLEKQPQREIRVVAVKENDHNAFQHYENTTTSRDREGSSDIHFFFLLTDVQSF